MPVLKNIAAIAKGMSITFMEMFQPTTVENYPAGGPSFALFAKGGTFPIPNRLGL
jgi:hypothetical protein